MNVYPTSTIERYIFESKDYIFYLSTHGFYDCILHNQLIFLDLLIFPPLTFF